MYNSNMFELSGNVEMTHENKYCDKSIVKK